MTSHTTARFRKAFAQLPATVQHQARGAYRQFQQNPHHPSLRFKPVHPVQPVYSVRIGLDYRAVGIRDGDTMIWFWIGAHSEYDGVLRQM